MNDFGQHVMSAEPVMVLVEARDHGHVRMDVTALSRARTSTAADGPCSCAKDAEI